MTRLEVAQICVEVDVSKPLHHFFWLGSSVVESSHYQEVVFETIPTFCLHCRKQGHFVHCCKRKESNQNRAGNMKPNVGKLEKLKKMWKVESSKE